jgi:hypothetical protein
MPHCLRRDYAVYILVSSLSGALFRIILLTFRVTEFTAVLHAGSLVSCYNFLNCLLCFINRSRPGIGYFRSKLQLF